MKTICITGLLPYYNDAVMDILVLGGVMPAAHSTRNEALDMRTWHQRLTHSLGGLPGPGYEPGRLWEQLAGDVFMANLHVPMWGWADSASLGLLDFWRDFDAGVHFLLLHIPAEQWLADQLANGAADPAQLLAQWESATQEMLRFHLRNQDRSSIVDAALAVQAPRRLLEACHGRWNLSLGTQSDFAPAAPERGILPAYLGNQLAAAAAGLADLQHEINATCIDLDVAHASTVVGFADVLAEYHQHSGSTQQLLTCAEELRQAKLSLAGESQRATRLDVENGQLLFQLQAVQEELQAAIQSFDTQRALHQEQQANSQRQLQTQLDSAAEAQAAHNAAMASAQKKHAAEQARLKREMTTQAAKLADSTEQLQQQQAASTSTQERLHTDNNKLRSELEHLHQEQQANSQRQLQTQLNSAAEAKAAHDAAMASAQKKHAAEQARLKREMTTQAAKLADSTEQLQQQQTASTSTQERLHTDNNKLRSELEHLRKRLGEQELGARKQKTQCVELERDNAQLLLQFTGVQEELELALQARQQDARNLATASANATRLAQELEQSNAHLKHWQQRATRMELRLPGYVDYQSLALMPVKREGHGLAHCHLTGLEQAGGGRDVSFTLLLENGTIGFAFEQADHALARWPHAAEGRDVVDIIPASHPTDGLLRAATLKQLSTGDWLLTQQLIRVLTDALAEPCCLPEGTAASADDISKGLVRLHNVLDQLPPILRFDNAELVRAYASDDYEHLEIRLRGVMLGALHSAEFVFRLACAHGQGMPFGTHPRLEFPHSKSTNLFEHWFEESSNIHGPKLELRFAAPDLMDLDVWQKISPADQALIVALCDQLEDIVGMVSTDSNAELPREWNQWSVLATGMRRTLALRSARKAPDSPELLDPGHADHPSLTLTPVQHKGHGLAHCRLTGLEQAGGGRDVSFTLLLENGTIGFAFAQADHALTRWPHAAEGREVIDMIPASHPTDSLLRAATLKQLSTNDWLLTQQLIRVLTDALAEPNEPNCLPDGMAASADDISKGLVQLRRVLGLLPPILRFNSAELVSAYASDDYEHLEIRLRGVMLGALHSAEFVFRLACAKVQGMPFGTHPRLEFPHSKSANLFERWFEESSNIHGPKLELRFATPDLMDLDVWQKISPADQALIVALCDQLEDIVCMVSADATVELSREWGHWPVLAAGIRRTLALRSARKAPGTAAIHTLS